MSTPADRETITGMPSMQTVDSTCDMILANIKGHSFEDEAFKSSLIRMATGYKYLNTLAESSDLNTREILLAAESRKAFMDLSDSFIEGDLSLVGGDDRDNVMAAFDLLRGAIIRKYARSTGSDPLPPTAMLAGAHEVTTQNNIKETVDILENIFKDLHYGRVVNAILTLMIRETVRKYNDKQSSNDKSKDDTADSKPPGKDDK